MMGLSHPNRESRCLSHVLSPAGNYKNHHIVPSFHFTLK